MGVSGREWERGGDLGTVVGGANSEKRRTQEYM